MQHENVTTHVLKNDGGRAVWMSHVPGSIPLTFKSWVLTPWFLFKFIIGIAQPWRHLRGAGRLRRAGIPTPSVAFIRPGWRRRRPVILLVMPYVEGVTALDHLRIVEGSPAVDLAKQLGRYVSMLSEADLRHRDFKLTNVVIETGTDHPWLIDPVGVVRDRDRITSLATMLDRLDVEIREGHVGELRDVERLRRIILKAALVSAPSSVRRAVLQRLRTHPRP